MEQERNRPKIFVAGSTGMVGSALCRRLMKDSHQVLVGPNPRVDLCDQAATRALLEDLKPDWVFLAAAKVGGIEANRRYPADFIYVNLAIEANVLDAAYRAGVKKLLLLGSSCIYPREAPQPMKEEYLLTGRLEPTNEAYAVAKIAGIKMAQAYNQQYGTNFISAMPTNLYGPGDNFDLETSHVVAALLRKTHEAKKSRQEFFEVWGTGKPRREFLHVDDLADACVFLMEHYNSTEIINVGTGRDVTIQELAVLVKEVVGYSGSLRFNPAMPDGTMRKLMDVRRLTELGWKPSLSLRRGLEATYEWYLAHEGECTKSAS